MPIHIIRDVAITIRSFYKRITDFLRYRHATRDMNERYPDALAEEIAREDVCIICRETMRPWRRSGANEAAPSNVQGVIDERLRPKKLPCGHILHFACLRSWLERQQNCPTCRSPVLTPSNTRSQGPQQLNPQVRAQNHMNAANDAAAHQGHGQPGGAPNRVRVFNFGPFRLGFGAGHDIQGVAQQMNNMQAHNHQPNPANGTGDIRHQASTQQLYQSTAAPFGPTAIQMQLQNIEQQLMQQINALRVQADQLYMVRALQGELARIRIAQATQGRELNSDVMIGGLPLIYGYETSQGFSRPTVHSQDLPPGLTIPEGWTLMPLQRISQTNPTNSIPTNVFQNTEARNLMSSPSNLQSVSSSSSTTAEHGDFLQGEERGSYSGWNMTRSPAQVSFDQESGSAHGISEPSKGLPAATHEHSISSGSAHSASVPQWSSRPLEPGTVTTRMARSSIPETVNREAAASGNTQDVLEIDNSSSKGKGRAVTVEDAEDDAA